MSTLKITRTDSGFQIETSRVVNNPKNPRVITKKKFDELVESIADFPEMMNARPIVVDPDGVIIGGNQRYRACKQLGWKEIPVYVATWDAIRHKEFLIKDNVHSGFWDLDVIANEYDSVKAQEWGLDVYGKIDTYAPMLEPTANTREYKDEDFDGGLQGISKQVDGKLDITCPDCAHEFYVKI